MSQFTILYLCPLGQQHRDWRLAAAPPEFNVIIRRSTEVSHEEVLQLVPQADALISERIGIIDAAIINAGTNLKIIQRLGSLYHDIDRAAARARNITVCTRPIRGVIAVAEQMMMQILGLCRRILPLQKVVHREPESFTVNMPLGPNNAPTQVPFKSRRTTEDVFAFNWSNENGVRLIYGKTIGILGFGEIGAELARRLQGWNCRVLYSKRQRLSEEIEQTLHIEFRDQEAILRESDIVVSLLPYFEQTDQWLNTTRIATMKPGAFLCHAGSGSVIDEQAVADAVRSGQLGGASFDTYEWEPIKQDNPLLVLADNDPEANILLTPHIGSCNDVNNSEFIEFYGNVWNFLNGKAIEGRVS